MLFILFDLFTVSPFPLFIFCSTRILFGWLYVQLCEPQHKHFIVQMSQSYCEFDRWRLCLCCVKSIAVPSISTSLDAGHFQFYIAWHSPICKCAALYHSHRKYSHWQSKSRHFISIKARETYSTVLLHAGGLLIVMNTQFDRIVTMMNMLNNVTWS